MSINQFLLEGKHLCEKGDFDKAINVFQKGLDLDPANTELLYNQAKAYFRLKKLEQSLSIFNQLVSQQPSNAELLSELGVLYHHMGDNASALEKLDQAAVLEPQNPFRYSSRAWIKANNRDLEGAIADYEKAIELDPEDSISYNNKGLLEEQLGFKQKSKESFEASNKIIGYQPKIKDEKVEKPKEVPPKPSEKLTTKSYLGTIKSLFTSKEERREFIDFLLRRSDN